MRTAHWLLQEMALRREDRFASGRDAQGVASPRPEESSTWVVTQVEPVLMAWPATGGKPVSVESTDAIKGVRPGHRIRVEVRGAGSRVAVALLDQLPIKQRDTGESVSSINGKDITVGGSTVLDAGDVGALPADTTLADLGYTPPSISSHTHSVTVGSTQCAVSPPGGSIQATLYSSWSSGDDWATARSRVNDIYSVLHAMRDRINGWSGQTWYCSGCGAAGSVTTSSSGGSSGGGNPTPVNPGERSIVINSPDPTWYEPGSPDSFSGAWADDIQMLINHAHSAISGLSGRTFGGPGGSGTITLRDSVEALWDLPPSYAYSYQWGDEVQSQIGRLYSMFNTLTGTYNVTGGGSVTVGQSISNPAQSAPSNYTQAWGASVRLALNRLISSLQQICGASYRY